MVGNRPSASATLRVLGEGAGAIEQAGGYHLGWSIRRSGVFSGETGDDLVGSGGVGGEQRLTLEPARTTIDDLDPTRHGKQRYRDIARHR